MNIQTQNKTKQYIRIQSSDAGKVLDVKQDGQQKGGLILYDWYGGKNQQFSINPVGLQVMFESRQTNLYLTVAYNSDKNGAVIREEPYNHQSNQRFRLQPVGNDKQYIIFTFCGKALDCFEQQSKNGTSIIQWDFHGKDNQKWIIKKNE